MSNGTYGASDRLLAYMQKHRGAVLSMNDLVQAVYGHAEDGGPVKAEATIRVLLCRLKKDHPSIEPVRGYVYR